MEDVTKKGGKKGKKKGRKKQSRKADIFHLQSLPCREGRKRREEKRAKTQKTEKYKAKGSVQPATLLSGRR